MKNRIQRWLHFVIPFWLIVFVPITVNAQSSDTLYYYVYPLPDWAYYSEGIIEKAIEAWKEANPTLRFMEVSSPSRADFAINWVKDFGGLHVGYALGYDYIEVGLGDSNCGGQWLAYHPNTVEEIAKHELGHILGFEHSSDPNSIMYPEISFVQYLNEPYDFVSAPGYINFFPLCTSLSVTSYKYNISTDDLNGFDVYFVPSISEYENYGATPTFNYYSGKGCWATNVREFSGTCKGVSGEAGLLVILPEESSKQLITISANLEEVVYAGSESTQQAHGYYDNTTPDSNTFSGTATIRTDKTNYNFEESISFSGKLSNPNKGIRVQVVITDPLGQIVGKSRLVTTTTGEFQSFTAIPSFHPKGEYTIAAYNDQGSFLGDARFSIDSNSFQPSDPFFDKYPKLGADDKFKKFQSEEFSMLYPDSWLIDNEIADLGTNPGLWENGISYVLFYDKQDWNSYFEVRYYEKDFGAINYSGEQYLNYLVDVLRNDCKIASFDEAGFTCSNHSITNSQITEVNGRQVYQTTETWTETYPDGLSYRNLRIITEIPIGDNVWSVDSSTTSSVYPQYSHIIKKMIDSFKITDIDSTAQKDIVSPLIMVPSDIALVADDQYGAFVEYNVEAIDESDGILTPNCTPSSSSFFPIGETTVFCNVKDYSGNLAERSFVVKIQSSSVIIPDWIKNVADFWCKEKIEDSSFIEGIQYLINNKIIVIQTTGVNKDSSNQIPQWIRDNACWWSEDIISDKDFVNGLRFLIKGGIIHVN